MQARGPGYSRADLVETFRPNLWAEITVLIGVRLQGA